MATVPDGIRMASRDDADEGIDLAALSVPALIALARAADDEGDSHWTYVAELHRRGDAETFEAADALTRDEDPEERVLGADVLAQIGYQHPREEPYTGIRRLAVVRLHELLTGDDDLDVVEAAIAGLGRQSARDALHDVVTFAMHPDPELRGAVARAFPGLTGWGEDLAELGVDDARLAIGTLVALSGDEDGDVRNWALFALARQYEIDTPELRDLFVQHLDDAHEEAREEAMAGLARRRDGRAFDAVLAALDPEVATRVAIEAAAQLGDERLLESLEELVQLGWDDDETLQDAIRACDPEQRARWEMIGAALATTLRQVLRAHAGAGAFTVEVGLAPLEHRPSLRGTWTGTAGRPLALDYDLLPLFNIRLERDLDRAAEAFREDVATTERDA